MADPTPLTFPLKRRWPDLAAIRARLSLIPAPWLLFLLTVSVRLAPAIFIVGTEDVGLFYAIASAVQLGHNPYSEVAITWPPLWATMVTLSKDVADFTGLPFHVAMKAWAILTDGLISLVLYSWWRARSDDRAAFRFALLWALNPASIYITAFHGQFDSIPAACVLLAALSAQDQTSGDRDVPAWWLGIGGLAKTWPLFVVPAFLQGTWRDKARFVLIAALPSAATMSILFLLDPLNVADKVLRYRGAPGWWGFTGIDLLAHSSTDLTTAATLLFYAACAVTALLYFARRKPAEGSLAILLAFLAFTPGFGPQYLVWIIPVALIVDRRRAFLYSVVVGAVLFAEGFMRPHNGVFGDHMRQVPSRLFVPYYAHRHDKVLTIIDRMPLWIFCLFWWMRIVLDRTTERFRLRPIVSATAKQ
jgi:hypothetical protein